MGAHERAGSGRLSSSRRDAQAPSTSEHPSPPLSRVDPPLRVEAVTDLADLDALAGPWASLVHRSPHATAYASPAFVLTWYRHFEQPGGIYAVAVWHGDDLVGIAPFARTSLGWGPASASLLVSAGTEHGDYGEPLVGRDADAVAAAIADHLAGLVRRRTVINVRRLREGGALLRALEAHDGLRRAPMGYVAEASVVRFDQLDDPARHLQRLARKHNVPRRLRRLAEAHGEVAYLPDVADVTLGLDAMRDMLRRRWPAGEGPPMFASPGTEAFWRDAIRALVESGFGRVAMMTAGGRPLAVSTVLEIDDRQVSDNAAYEPDFARFGPGQAEMHMMLTHALATGATEVDLRAGDFPYKHRWANASHRTRSLVLTTPGLERDAMLGVRRVAMSLRARRLSRH